MSQKYYVDAQSYRIYTGEHDEKDRTPITVDFQRGSIITEDDFSAVPADKRKRKITALVDQGTIVPEEVFLRRQQVRGVKLAEVSATIEGGASKKALEQLQKQVDALMAAQDVMSGSVADNRRHLEDIPDASEPPKKAPQHTKTVVKK
jgi:hypothetical protein